MDRPAADCGVTPDTLRLAVARLIGEAEAAQACFGVAVSGGPDSMALLTLAAAAFPGQVSAATIDHQLRAESADEAAMVARLCAERGIAHAILTPAAPITGSVQAAARVARYALLDRWRQESGLDWLMTAHHADDQLETLVMRLNRSSGVGGLAGIRVRQGRVLRPLLGARRAALEQWCADKGIPFASDPSNSDARFDRARVRTALLGQALLDPVAVNESAALLDEADRALDWTVDRLADERMTATDAAITLILGDLPQELARRLVLRALARLEPDRPPPRRSALDHAMSEIMAGRQTMLGDVMVTPAPAAPGVIMLAPAPPRRASPSK